MDRLHLDAKTTIARTSVAAWNALMRADPIFGRYALTDAGRSEFLAAFTVVKDGEWGICGRPHRIGGPALKRANGYEGWFEYGMRHRIGGPAVIYLYGNEEWYERGRLHRIGGPARIYSNGDEEWLENGEYHRIDGPAIVHADGTEQWYTHGMFVHHPK